MTNKEIVINFFKALDDKDYATAQKYLGSSHQMHSSMSPVPMDAEQHLAMSKVFDEAFTNGKHEWADIFEVDNKVVARGIWSGVHTGNFNGIAATGKNVALTFIAIIEIENNEMKHQWVEMNAMSLMMQLGAVPAPAHS